RWASPAPSCAMRLRGGRGRPHGATSPPPGRRRPGASRPPRSRTAPWWPGGGPLSRERQGTSGTLIRRTRPAAGRHLQGAARLGGTGARGGDAPPEPPPRPDRIGPVVGGDSGRRSGPFGGRGLAVPTVVESRRVPVVAPVRATRIDDHGSAPGF